MRALRSRRTRRPSRASLSGLAWQPTQTGGAHACGRPWPSSLSPVLCEPVFWLSPVLRPLWWCGEKLWWRLACGGDLLFFLAFCEEVRVCSLGVRYPIGKIEHLFVTRLSKFVTTKSYHGPKTQC